MLKLSIAIIAAGLCITGCEKSMSLPYVIFDRAAWEFNRAAWEAQGITSYTFEGLDQNNQSHARITVTDGQITSIEKFHENYDFWGNPIPPIVGEKWGTVPDIFDWIASKYEEYHSKLNDLPKGDRFWFEIKYNMHFHYPEMIQFNRHSGTNKLFSEGPRFDINNLVPVRE